MTDDEVVFSRSESIKSKSVMLEELGVRLRSHFEVSKSRNELDFRSDDLGGSAIALPKKRMFRFLCKPFGNNRAVIFPSKLGLLSMTTPQQNTTGHLRGGMIAFIGLFGLLVAVPLVDQSVTKAKKIHEKQADQMEAVRHAQFILAHAHLNRSTSIEHLLRDRKQIERARDALRAIPDFVGSPYAEAQAEAAKLKSLLATMNQRIGVDEATLREWETAFQLGSDAIAVAQTSPQPLENWKKAKADLEKSIQILSAIPEKTLGSAELKVKVAKYRKQSGVITQKIAAEEKAMKTVNRATAIAKQATALAGRNDYISKVAVLQNAKALWQGAIVPLKQVPINSYVYEGVESYIATYAANIKAVDRAIGQLEHCQKISSPPITCGIYVDLKEPDSLNR